MKVRAFWYTRKIWGKIIVRFSIYYFRESNSSEMRCVIIDREEIFRLIVEERERQDRLHPIPKKKNHDDTDINAVRNMILCNEFLAILVEEVGEVAQALQGEGELKDEIVQVASVCVRWLENIK